jgi:acetylornithine deacetylase/succinyl-diaminopimelate desuccinylase-like protein
MTDATAEVTDLLQQLIRNRCVNEATPTSGHEHRNAAILQAYLGDTGLAIERFEPLPGRTSIVARIEGSDPTAPSLCLMGHTDVVPANEAGWHRDPFGGELVDGVVWGRGAVDMLNVTASMAVAFRKLAREGFKPRGSLVYFAVADEEAAGIHGAKWITENATDAVRTDYVLTEYGGMRMSIGGGPGPKMPVMVAEKGTYWITITVRGTPGHASMPYRTDNALVKGAEIVRRLAEFQPQTKIGDIWRSFVLSMEFPPDVQQALLDPARLDDFVEAAPPELGRLIHACTHTSIAPTVSQSGVKSNIIPDTFEMKVDIRTLPGETAEDVQAMLREALGELAADIEINRDSDMESTSSPVDTPLMDALSRVTGKLVPGAQTVPFILVAATDSRYFRRIGTTAYGYGLFSDRISLHEFGRMFHGDDERIDQASLRLTTELWEQVARDLLGG